MHPKELLLRPGTRHCMSLCSKTICCTLKNKMHNACKWLQIVAHTCVAAHRRPETAELGATSSCSLLPSRYGRGVAPANCTSISDAILLMSPTNQGSHPQRHAPESVVRSNQPASCGHDLSLVGMIIRLQGAWHIALGVGVNRPQLNRRLYWNEMVGVMDMGVISILD